MEISSLKYVCGNHCEVFEEGLDEEEHCLVLWEEGDIEDWDECYHVDYYQDSCNVRNSV